MDGGEWKSLRGAPAIGSKQLAGLADGQHTVSVRLVNANGTVVTDDTTFTVETAWRRRTPPVRATILFADCLPTTSVSSNRPSEDELRRGMTVEIEQSNAENASDAEPLRGEIQQVVDEGDSPQGVKVRLQSGATGYVQNIVTD